MLLKQIIKLLTATLLLALFLAANITSANSQVTLTVKHPNPYLGNHSWFIYERGAGSTIQDIATLKNFGDQEANVNIYAVDATSSETGSFILTFPEEEQKNIGVWTNVEVKNTTIQPNQSIDIPFTIKIPEGAAPGQYTGGIVVESQGTSNSSGINNNDYCIENNLCGGNISIKTRIGSRIYLTVPGNMSGEIHLSSFQAEKTVTGTTRFKFSIENNTNITYEPKALIEVFDGLGNPYERVEKILGTSTPGTTINPVVNMENRPVAGNFTAQATVQFTPKFASSEILHGANLTQTQKINFWVMPWEIIFAAILLLAACATCHLRQRAAKKKWLENTEEYIIQANDNLMELAAKRNISWKKIAKFNKLKAPYILKQGDSIRIPKTPSANGPQ